jgi:NAD(P)-dependent dehydrogenase (short-subunit alcohol dehydrogenase family)
MTEGPLAGRKVLVVGAGTRHLDDPEAPVGNGRAIAVVAGRAGAVVACADIDTDAAPFTAALVEAEGATAHVLTADVTDADACAAMVTEAANALGGLDALVLNVGIGRGRGLAETKVEDWDLVFSVNLRSHFLTLQSAMPVLADGSSVVLISSIAGLKPGTGIPAYDASKAGQFGLARFAAKEGSRRRIRVNTVVPGLIDTPLGRVASKGRPSRAETAPFIPLGRFGTAEEVADSVVFLLSDEARYITGQTLVVDGGLSTL